MFQYEKDIKVPDEDLPYFEDRLRETNTRRVDWLVGYNSIANMLGINSRMVRNLIAESDIPVEMVKPINGGNSKNTHNYIALVSKLEEWETKQRQQLRQLPPPPPAQDNTEDNLLQRLIKEQEETNKLLRSLWSELRELVTLWRGQQA